MVVLSDENLFHYGLVTFYLIGPSMVISSFFFQAPYGRHYRPGWGPTISPTLAWLLMEFSSITIPVLLFSFGQHSTNPKALLLMTPFLLHYFHRTCIYPFRIYWCSETKRGNAKTSTSFPLNIALFGCGCQILNTYLQTRWVSHYKSDYASDLFWWKFFGGLVVFLWGMKINLWADTVLLGLKRESGGYKIPRGGWFELVSCPNYLGEIVEWLGWSVMTWSWAGFSFFHFTCCNLMPRAIATHKWYMEKFREDYPKTRKAIIPFFM